MGSIKNYTVDSAENTGSGTTGSTYTWSVIGPSFSGTITNTNIGSTNASTINWGQSPPGNYIVSVKETNTNGCSSIQNLQVIIKPLPVVHLNDLIICTDPVTGNLLNQGIINTGLSSNVYSFEWQKDGITLPFTSSSIYVSQVGVYSVKVTNILTGCQATDLASVSISSLPQATVTITNSFEDVQNIVVTILNGIGSYEYSIDGINFQDTGTFTVSLPGQYNVIIRDKFFCGQIILPAFASGYPHFFTPNGDGYNDFWNIVAIPNPSKARTYIYDRYGKLIHQINAKNQNWDGTFNGEQLPADDYWFLLEYFDTSNNFQTFKSHFSLMR
jgi:gliding motility-associated-like protein